MNADTLYTITIKNLQIKILNDFGTLKTFAKHAEVGYTNLSKCFSERQIMSLDLYIRVCTALGIIVNPVAPRAQYQQVTLLDYLKLDITQINYSILEINTQ